jgi:hypothetical protein
MSFSRLPSFLFASCLLVVAAAAQEPRAVAASAPSRQHEVVAMRHVGARFAAAPAVAAGAGHQVVRRLPVHFRHH